MGITKTTQSPSPHEIGMGQLPSPPETPSLQRELIAMGKRVPQSALQVCEVRLGGAYAEDLGKAARYLEVLQKGGAPARHKNGDEAIQIFAKVAQYGSAPSVVTVRDHLRSNLPVPKGLLERASQEVARLRVESSIKDTLTVPPRGCGPKVPEQV